MSQDIPQSLKLRVITSRKLLVDEDVQEVSLPSLEGYLGIRPGHRNLFVALGEGRITYRRVHAEENFSVRGGYAQILPDRVTVFTELGRENADGSEEG